MNCPHALSQFHKEQKVRRQSWWKQTVLWSLFRVGGREEWPVEWKSGILHLLSYQDQHWALSVANPECDSLRVHLNVIVIIIINTFISHFLSPGTVLTSPMEYTCIHSFTQSFNSHFIEHRLCQTLLGAGHTAVHGDGYSAPVELPVENYW